MHPRSTLTPPPALNRAQTCPLCGQSNACAMAPGSAAPCWCMSADWTGQLAPALPADLPGDQCVCAACAQRLLATPPTPTR
ncbi:hypothetical protein CCO03_01295 [Comamonas serinivorans]|uniref:Cysteine-rich CWC family protein n=1 Tax=Comamonas serinivorans TaxID=1082851 RepID=A0A1Y0EJ92_9BURK|nr:cysteine-rich CWC family protein [Comamonas serinivorans]ARU03498.1 hypothetical protein CCO03_01295 [Comamonas serinivorans]